MYHRNLLLNEFVCSVKEVFALNLIIFLLEQLINDSCLNKKIIRYKDKLYF